MAGLDSRESKSRKTKKLSQDLSQTDNTPIVGTSPEMQTPTMP